MPQLGLRAQLRGAALLVAASFLWGTSFPAIKVLVGGLDPLSYTWMRGALAAAALAPYVARKAARGELDRAALEGGLKAGAAYTLGLWLQGLGTAYTTASNSAFITALHVVFVHAYVALVRKKYGPDLAAALALSVSGAYLLTLPSAGSARVGDLIVLAGSLGWAAQVLLVDKYSSRDPLQVVFAQFLASVSLALPDALLGGIPRPTGEQLALLAYLAAACGVGAFTLQVLGQRRVGPAASAVIYQTEPVFAAALSKLFLGESLGGVRAAGAALVVLAAATSALSRDVKAGASGASELATTAPRRLARA